MALVHGFFLWAQIFLQPLLDREDAGQVRYALLLLSEARGLVEPLTTGGPAVGNNN